MCKPRQTLGGCVCPSDMAWGVTGRWWCCWGGGTLSDASLVVNRKWHSSSSAFPPPPQLVLFLFCPMFFLCVGVLIVMSWTGRRGPAHVHDAVPEVSPYENKSLMSSRTRAWQLREATALEVKKKHDLTLTLTLRIFDVAELLALMSA